jgi:hypothetical protein
MKLEGQRLRAYRRYKAILRQSGSDLLGVSEHLARCRKKTWEE